MKPVALLLVCLFCAAAHLSAQQAETPTESELDKLIRVAKTGRTAFRPQAARRLVKRGAPAAERLLAECGETNADLAALGNALVEVLGEFGDTPLRAKAWSAIDDRDFPWRPAAARGLAVQPLAEEASRFETLTTDPISAVRKAAVEAVGALPPADGHLSLLRARLADPEGRVRRAAAGVLADRGAKQALWWLFAELGRDDRFFDRPDGKLARYDAARALGKRIGELTGYDAENGPEGNVEALEAIRAKLTELAGEAPELPPVARARKAPIDAVLGLELRSCRLGEVFVRWDRRDVLWVGVGNPARVELAPGTSHALLALVEKDLAEIGERRFWGQAGCDMEQLHVRPEAATTTLIVAKGPEAIQSLRPAALTRLLGRLAQSLPKTEADDPRVTDLGRRVRETLAALGGPVE
ncbi:MAG: hypothetical protein GY711_20835 [bacterium]|nr:hypothetical protein [bacterium]